MKKRPVVIFVCLLILCLLTSTVATHAEIYVEGFLGGGGFGSSGSPAFETGGTSSPSLAATPAPPNFTFVPPGSPGSFVGTGTVSTFSNAAGLDSDPYVIGGVKLGTWFDGRPLPCNPADWMKYFGVYLELGFQDFDSNSHGVSKVAQNTTASGGGLFVGNVQNEFSSDGFALSAAVMLAARYGYMPDKEAPFGRFQPYIGIGPALFYATMNPKLTTSPYTLALVGGTGALTQPNSLVTNMGSASDVTIGFAVEPGIRYMLTKSVSIDFSFKYLYANPSFTCKFTGPFSGASNSTTFSPDLNFYSAQVGLAYHFY